MDFGRWLLALLSVLAMGAGLAMPAMAGAQEEAPEIEQPAVPDDDAGAPADDPVTEDAGRQAVPGRVPARVREQLVAARRSLRDAKAAAARGNERRAAAHLRRAVRALGVAHDAAVDRAEDEKPGGVAAVRAVTAAQHRVIGVAVDLALDADSGLYDRAIAAAEQVAEDRDEAARLLVDTQGADDETSAVGDEVTAELDDLQAVVDDEDEDVADDLADLVQAVSDTADALGLASDEDQPADDADTPGDA